MIQCDTMWPSKFVDVLKKHYIFCGFQRYQIGSGSWYSAFDLLYYYCIFTIWKVFKSITVYLFSRKYAKNPLIDGFVSGFFLWLLYVINTIFKCLSQLYNNNIITLLRCYHYVISICMLKLTIIFYYCHVYKQCY